MFIMSVFLEDTEASQEGLIHVIDTKGLASLGNSFRRHLKQNRVVEMSKKVFNLDVLVVR